jgi:hypothetical protein
VQAFIGGAKRDNAHPAIDLPKRFCALKHVQAALRSFAAHMQMGIVPRTHRAICEDPLRLLKPQLNRRDSNSGPFF